MSFMGSAPTPIALDAFPSHCAHITSALHIPDTVVNFAEYVPNGTVLTFSEHHPTCESGLAEPIDQMVKADLCRLSLTVATSGSSEITMEAWLPQQWNGRFLSVGNRGLSGCIRYTEMVMTSSLGFATVGANNGHNGTSGEDFFNSPDVLEDFVYRSVHTGVQVGKKVTKKFYGHKHRKSYYLGCSTGGRQGFKSAQDFPDDFDGIIAGSPAIAMTRLISWSLKFYVHTGGPESESFLSVENWALVFDEVMRQCDGLDGTLDNLLDDPDTCNFFPETLICKDNAPAGCLNVKQAAAVRGIFSPVYDSKGDLAFPRMQPGINTKDFVPFYFSGAPFDISVDWARYIAYNDSTWDPDTYSMDDLEYWRAQNPFNVDTWNGDLSAFENKGGKLLSYHGSQDFVISSELSSLYYSHVASTMNKPISDLASFYRLFYVSGLEHCTGGPGYTALGQDTGYVGDIRPGYNILMDMVQWVENGVAPDVIRGAKLGDAGEVQGWKPHCMWPQKTRFVTAVNGTGEWMCVGSETLGVALRDEL